MTQMENRSGAAYLELSNVTSAVLIFTERGKKRRSRRDYANASVMARAIQIEEQERDPSVVIFYATKSYTEKQRHTQKMMMDF